jgi:hypothetical protein
MLVWLPSWSRRRSGRSSQASLLRRVQTEAPSLRLGRPVFSQRRPLVRSGVGPVVAGRLVAEVKPRVSKAGKSPFRSA